MIITVGFAGIVFGAVIGYLVRDVVAYRPPSKRRRVGLDQYWRSWPAMIQELRKITDR
jgi:hypothetical protein|tara:strand:- start:253 stop:426 length:174 start_codon:yes stop_codon:yes gene_type:complete